MSIVPRLWRFVFAVHCTSALAYAQTSDSVVCTQCVIDKITPDSAFVRADTVITNIFKQTPDTTFRDSVVQVPTPPPVVIGPSGCSLRQGWQPMTYQEFDAPVGYGTRVNGWQEETRYVEQMQFANSIMTGTWRKGLPGGVGPYNVTYHGRNVTSMHLCIRVKLNAGMTIPNNGLKQGFWKSAPVPGKSDVNHVFEWRHFPRITTQFNPSTSLLDGYKYSTTHYCNASGAAGTAPDKSVYTVRPRNATNLRDGQFHVLEYLIVGGTPGAGNAAFTVALDGKIVCQTTGARWYAGTMAGHMFGISLNPNSSAGGLASSPPGCPQPNGNGNDAWCTREEVYYDLIYIEGR